ncbi:MAG: hypothetical protein M1128_02885 [Candidatus Marsarchaeota archaeon]|nr:hypothetical protein [Candidatus Marsarchaeota archaeon]
MLKAQSAVEFLSVYGFVILVIAIAIAVLVLFISIPKTILPTQCSFLSGFSCVDGIYTINSTAGVNSILLISATDMQPGIVNISRFSGYIDYHESTSGYCVPSVATEGQKVYCIANIGVTPSFGSVYFGTFDIYANYCTPASSNFYTTKCPADSNYTYGGNIRTQTVKLNFGKNTNTQINITNSQKSAVPAHFQELVSFNPSGYVLYERPDLGNIRFYYKSKELYSWCEANCSSSATGNAIFWVKIPVAIPPSHNLSISMYILPLTVGYSGQYAGEAPQLSCPDPADTAGCATYGKYDNGANVFDAYWNFSGTTLPPSLIPYTSSGSSIIVDQGLTVDTGSGSWAGVVSASKSIAPIISETFVESQSGGALSGGIAQQIGYYTYSAGYDFNGWSGSIGEGSLSVGMNSGQNIDLQIATPGVDGMAWVSDNSQAYYKNYVLSFSTASDLSMPKNLYTSLGVFCCSGGDIIRYYWLLTRTYPPNGVMPVAHIGSVSIIS